MSARHLLSGQQLACGVSFQVDFHQPRHTYDSQPSPAPQPARDAAFVLEAHRRNCDLQVSCYRRVAECVRCLHFLVTLALSLRYLRRECLTVGKTRLAGDDPSFHFRPRVRPSVRPPPFCRAAKQQTCRCSSQLRASRGLFWKQFVGPLARPCDQVKERGGWRGVPMPTEWQPGRRPH